MFIPGCGCCGSNRCAVCPECDIKCFEVTFSGFSAPADAAAELLCSECKFINNAKIVLRPFSNMDGEPAIQLGATPGDGAALTPTLTRQSNGSWAVTAIAVNSGGTAYDEPTLTAVAAVYADNAVICRPPAATFTVEDGVIQSATVTDGGEIWYRPAVGSCLWYGGVCGGCPGWQTAGTVVLPNAEVTPTSVFCTLVLGAETHTLSVYATTAYMGGESPVFTATIPAVDGDGVPVPCNSLSFENATITGCDGSGTITVKEIDCDAETVDSCEMPDQLAFTFKFPARSWSGGDPYTVYGEAYYSDTAAVDEIFILDRVSDCVHKYEGPGVSASFIRAVNYLYVFVDPPVATPGWYPVQPELRTATAVVGSVQNEQVASVTVTDGGSGYEYEIYEKIAPTLTLTADETNGGSGATFTATLEKIGDGDNARWGVASVAVTNGGSGYPQEGAIIVTPAEGDVTLAPASLSFRCGTRVAPTVTSVTIQQGYWGTTLGTGAVLQANLEQTFQYSNGGYGRPAWRVAGVTIVDGGSGYSTSNEINVTTDGETVSSNDFWEYDAYVTSVSSSGAITGIALSQRNALFAKFFGGADGEIIAVEKDGGQARRAPTVTAGGGSGSGAVFNVEMARIDKNPESYQPFVLTGWAVSNVAVTNGGSGYVNNEQIQFTVENNAVVVFPYAAHIRTVLAAPTLSGLDISAGANGGGAVFDASVLALVPVVPGADAASPCDRYDARWQLAGAVGQDVSGVIVSGGSGYVVNRLIRLVSSDAPITYPSGFVDYALPYLQVSSVDGNGSITGVKIFSRGSNLYRDTGVIGSVTLDYTFFGNGGLPACRSTGLGYVQTSSVPVGEYYNPHATGQMHTFTPPVRIESLTGLGATAVATVGDGAVSSISVTNGGQRYSRQQTAWIIRLGYNRWNGYEVYMLIGAAPSQQTECSSGRQPYDASVTLDCPSALIGKTFDMGAFTLPTRSTPTSGDFSGCPVIIYQWTTTLGAYVVGTIMGHRWYLFGGTAKVDAA